MLGLMCDNQYRLMQNYLREQKDNLFTIDLVGELANFAQVLCVCSMCIYTSVCIVQYTYYCYYFYCPPLPAFLHRHQP